MDQRSIAFDARAVMKEIVGTRTAASASRGPSSRTCRAVQANAAGHHSIHSTAMSTHGWLRLEVLEQEPLHALLMAADLRIGLQCSK